MPDMGIGEHYFFSPFDLLPKSYTTRGDMLNEVL
jgi:hypothetical protein